MDHPANHGGNSNPYSIERVIQPTTQPMRLRAGSRVYDH